MAKRKLINRINKFVEDSRKTFVTMAELEAGGSPCINFYQVYEGVSFELIERLFKNEAEAVMWVRGEESGSRFVSYAELSEDILVDIVNIVEAYENRELPELELNS